jgi:hypothetical protein
MACRCNLGIHYPGDHKDLKGDTMCGKRFVFTFILALLALSCQAQSLDSSSGVLTQTPKQQALSSLDDLQSQIDSLTKLNNDSLITITKQGQSLLEQGQQLTKLSDSLSFTGLINNILLPTSIVAITIAVIEAVFIFKK